ncbi:hypothetical protein [Vibrio sp. SCSIO 43136]|uniref:hypothetical protein n=1 Tax=Vibrio sp. SCSIO 43136 TaxID=2819101 RepID=UPI002075FFB3|nr:hypothetical protein [Vibrio sp. SCSIO 43136]USD65385.1 hypothetical protein J4N39_00505 [Vibrio sp. SCSIO 43136]
MWQTLRTSGNEQLKLSAPGTGIRVITLCVLLVLTLLRMESESVVWLSLGLGALLFAEAGIVRPQSASVWSTLGRAAGLFLLGQHYWWQLDQSMIWWFPALVFAAATMAFLLLLPKLDNILLPVLLLGVSATQLICAVGELWLVDSGRFPLTSLLGCLLLSAAILTSVSKHQFKPYLMSLIYIIGIVVVTLSALFG